MGEHGWVDMLTDVGRKLDRAESEGIARVAFYLRQNGQLQYAREVFMHLVFRYSISSYNCRGNYSFLNSSSEETIRVFISLM